MKKHILALICALVATLTGSAAENAVTLHHMDSATYEQLKAKYGASNIRKTKKRAMAETIPSHAINKSKGVGEIPITSGVSPTGARTYEVPVGVPEGLNNFTPKISLAYNSQQGNSALGMGWSIGGLAAITRCPASIYYDDRTEGITFDNNDCFMLAGQRLIRKQTENTHIWFETETGHIKAKGYLNNGRIYYFDVFYPDGTKGIFGDYKSGEAKLCHPIIHANDLHGNNIEYEYDHVQGSDYIKKITYNNAEIRFNYSQNRMDSLKLYSAGKAIEINRRLESISVWSDGKIFGNYALSYIPRYNTSVLDRISYSCGSTECTPLKFTYGNGEEEGYTDQKIVFYGPYYSAPEPDSLRVIRGKFDYLNNDDGIIIYPNRNSYFQKNVAQDIGTILQYKNTYRNNDTILVYTGIGDSYWPQVDVMTTGYGFLDLMCLDLKGQQKENIVRINSNMMWSDEELTFNVYDAHGITPLYSRTYTFPLMQSTQSAYNHTVHPKFFFPGDFNGDGRMEIFAISTYEANHFVMAASNCYIFDLENDMLLFDDHVFDFYHYFFGTEYPNPDIVNEESNKLFVMDYDGDGKTDICHVYPLGMDIYTFDNTPDGLVCRKVTTCKDIYTDKIKKRDLRICDFNGDGLMDIMLTPLKVQGNTIWSMYLSKGDGTFSELRVDYDVTHNKDHTVFMQDIDGDGISDLIRQNDASFTTYITRNHKPGSSSKTTLNPEKPLFIPTDMNSHNRYTQLVCIKDNILTKYSFNRHAPRDMMLTQMTNSLGVTEINRYERTNEGDDGFYRPEQDAEFPYVNLNEATVVLAESAVYMNGEQIEHNDFQYENAVAHRQGRGFCGFGRTWQHTHHGYPLEKTYDPYRFGVLTHESSPMAEKSYEYSINVSPDKFADIRLTATEEKDLLKGITATTGYEYDRYGYPTKSVTRYPGDITVTTENSYHEDTADGDGYYLGYLVDHRKTTVNAGSTYEERERVLSHIHRNPLVTVSSVNGNQVMRTANDFDAHGMLIVKQTQQYAAENLLRTDYSYDDHGRLTSARDPLGLTDEYSYDSMGRTKDRTDHLGGVTSYTYDDLGRVTGTTFPDGTTETVTYGWVDRDNRLYSITTQTTGQPTTVAYYDALNRKVRESVTRFDGSVLHTDYTYDKFGNVSAVSVPYKGDAPSLWNTYGYDFYNRPVTEEAATGWKKTYRYDGMSTTETAGGVTSKKTYDALGQLIQAEDAGGTITYGLGADGQIEKVTAPGNIVTTITYDGYRRRTAMDDPSFGKTTYVYDAAGNMSKQTDADGRSVTYAHDVFNRKTSVSTSEGTTQFTYDEFDRLVNTSADNGSEITTTFDEYGRVASSRESFAGKYLNRTFTYADGNVASISYVTQSGMTARENYTYANGHLKNISIENVFGNPFIEISESGTSIYNNGVITGYSIDSENSSGLVTSTSSSIIDLTSAYTDAGLLKSRCAVAKYVMASAGRPLPGILKESDAASSIRPGVIFPNDSLPGVVFPKDSLPLEPLPIEPIQTLLYNFDYIYNGATGNLTSKIEPEYDTWDDFYYDSQNRLTGTPFNKVSYDGKGNITRLSEFGDFTYDAPGKPYAVSGASLLDRWGTKSQQDITYTALSRPASIAEGNNRAVFSYNGTNDRVRMEVHRGDDRTLARYYLGGCYELDETPDGVMEKLYLTGDFYSAGIVLVEKDGKRSPYAIVRDEMGSITHVTGGAGSVRQDVRYDAWGSPRDSESMSIYKADMMPELFLGRGYTGHEHLPQFGLINMNARLYDPMLGRFLSPDPYVQLLGSTQSLNRFTYCMNNPTAYVDKDGEIFWFIIGAAVVGGVFNVATHWNEITSAGGWNAVLNGLGYFSVGALAGGAGAAVSVGMAVGIGTAGLAAGSSGIVAGFSSGAMSGFASGFIEGTGNSLLEGAGLGSAICTGVYSANMGFITGGITGGISGGRNALKQGKNLLYGADVPTVNAPVPATGTNTVSKPLQKHHFFTDKHKYYTPMFKDRLSRYGLDLNDSWNIELMPHRGRHPHELWEWMLKNLDDAHIIANYDRDILLREFQMKVFPVIRNNPDMLYKAYWKRIKLSGEIPGAIIK